MKQMIRAELAELAQNLYGDTIGEISFTVENTVNPEHGDLATNIAMQLTKLLKRNPRDIATEIVNNMHSPLTEKIEIAGPGFINFFLKPSALHSWLGDLLKNPKLLQSSLHSGKKAMVEFVSANPTGPLHIGHGRGAAVGDSIARVLSGVGYSVTKEYYVNDAGNQMQNLSASILYRYCELCGSIREEFPADGYRGEYIADIAKLLKDEHGEALLDMPREEAAKICFQKGKGIILAGIDATLKRFNIDMDVYSSEQEMYDKGEIAKCLQLLQKKGFTYEKDDALWFATTKFGDEKDRVLRKSDGTYTYLTPDIAYHHNKYLRGYDLLIDVWGADHHGYIKRMASALTAIGHPANSFEVVLVQMVGLLKDGEKAMMSTRAGEFITLDWLIDEVGADVARFFYNMRSANSQFDFDIDLAKDQSSENPVYYIQYAHARIMSLFANAADKNIKYKAGANLELLTSPAELSLIKKMLNFKYILETAAQHCEPHRLAYYLEELAGEFHGYYYEQPILKLQDANLINAKLSLCAGVAMAIKYGLGILGVNAPDKM